MTTLYDLDALTKKLYDAEAEAERLRLMLEEEMARRYAHKVDLNQEEIVETLRKFGVFVSITSGLGEGFPDLFVVYAGPNGPVQGVMEVKRPGERMTTDEGVWWAKFLFHGGVGWIVHSEEEAIGAIMGFPAPAHLLEES